jgi:hypothetical protein
MAVPGPPPRHLRAPYRAGRVRPYHEEDIHIGAGATLERTRVLKVAAIVESVIVQESGSRIDARSSGFETRLGPEYLRTIPTRRFSMFDSIRAAPGVSPTSPSSGTVNTVAAFGSGSNENLFLIDGTNFTCPCAGVSRAEPSVDVIHEVQIQSVGVSAEYGNIQGTVFNVITRQGSNRLLYDASYYGQTPGLTSQPVRVPMAATQPATGYERVRYRDFTTNAGGPVRRDRLWFFAGYQHLRDYDSQPGADPTFPRAYQQDKVFGKLTWHLKPGLQLMQSFHDEFWVNPQVPTQRCHCGLSESLRPKWREAAVCGSRHRVLVDTHSRRKESRDEVVARIVGCACDDHSPDSRNAAQRVEVRFECANDLFRLNHDEMIEPGFARKAGPDV